MLDDDVLQRILDGLPRLKFAVLGDLFLDRYLDLDAKLTEPSVETGLDAYQVVRVRSYPGAAGTVINNLAAFGLRAIYPIAVIGDDGEGYELRQALNAVPAVDPAGIHTHANCRTPTYTKPLLFSDSACARELNRFDIKNRHVLPRDAEAQIGRSLERLWPEIDGMIVLDQVSEPDCGVVTTAVREALTELAQVGAARIVLADSRERIGLFRNVFVKPNAAECLRAAGSVDGLSAAVISLARKAGRHAFCTQGEDGMLVAGPSDAAPAHVTAYPVTGPIDAVGAGDSTNAAIACALATGAGPLQAAAFGNLVASITIQQIGTTGTATPSQIRDRLQQARREN